MNSAITQRTATGFWLGSGGEDIKISVVKKARTAFSFGGGSPYQERFLIAAVTQATHDQSSEGMNLRDVDEENNQFDKMKKEDECVLTNMEKFFPELVNKLKSNLTLNVRANCELDFSKFN